MKIGERMKAARLQARLTQQQVADAIQSTKASVSQYEHDYYHPSLEALVKFSELTGASLDWLILGRETSTGYDKRIRELPEALKEYVVEALLLAERVQASTPAKFLRPPTSETYVEFSEYLSQLAKIDEKLVK
jgi:transcriptional regulator with XRE-family HTH domain